MRGAASPRWVLILAMSVWALAATLQGVAPIVSALIPNPGSEVRASEIEVAGHRLATCAHHPQGCPAKCLCPKTGFVGDESSQASGSSSGHDRLSAGATWMPCSEARSVAAPEFSVFLPVLPSIISVTIESNTFAPDAPALPRAAAAAPPAKIPIV
jgi:hypothetical protein